MRDRTSPSDGNNVIPEPVALFLIPRVGTLINGDDHPLVDGDGQTGNWLRPGVHTGFRSRDDGQALFIRHPRTLHLPPTQHARWQEMLPDNKLDSLFWKPKSRNITNPSDR